MNRKIRTLHDATKARLASKAREDAKHDRLEAKQDAKLGRNQTSFLQQHPEVGMLMRRGKAVFYVNNPYREANDPRQLVEG